MDIDHCLVRGVVWCSCPIRRLKIEIMLQVAPFLRSASGFGPVCHSVVELCWCDNLILQPQLTCKYSWHTEIWWNISNINHWGTYNYSVRANRTNVSWRVAWIYYSLRDKGCLNYWGLLIKGVVWPVNVESCRNYSITAAAWPITGWQYLTCNR